MTSATDWRTGVRVVRAKSLDLATGRATAFDFAGTAGGETWIGAVTLKPAAATGVHHHGNTELAVYVAKGRGRIRWGERLEFAAAIDPGDFVYFAPYVPHQELNADAEAPLDLVVVRSNRDGIAVALDIVPVDHPETPS